MPVWSKHDDTAPPVLIWSECWGHETIRVGRRQNQASTNLPPPSPPFPCLDAVVGGTNHTEWFRACEGWILPGRRCVDSERRSVGCIGWLVPPTSLPSLAVAARLASWLQSDVWCRELRSCLAVRLLLSWSKSKSGKSERFTFWRYSRSDGSKLAGAYELCLYSR
jgi:hypothetical protein